MLPILRLHANYGVHKFFRIEYTYFEINKLLICQNKNALFTLYTHDLLSATRSWQLSRIFLKIACLLLVIYVHIRKYGDCNTLKYHNTSRCEAEECTVYWSGEHYKVSLSTDRSGLDVAIFFFISGLSINRIIPRGSTETNLWRESYICEFSGKLCLIFEKSILFAKCRVLHLIEPYIDYSNI